MIKKILILLLSFLALLPAPSEAILYSQKIIISPTSINFNEVFIGQTRVIPVYIKNTTRSKQNVAKIVSTNKSILIQDFYPKNLNSCGSNPCKPDSVMWFSVVYKPLALENLNTEVSVVDERGVVLQKIKIVGNSAYLNSFNSIDITKNPYNVACDSDTKSAPKNRAAFQRAADDAGRSNKYLLVPGSVCQGGKYFPLNGYIKISGKGVIGVQSNGVKPYIKMIGANGGDQGDPSPHTIFSFNDWPGKTTAVFSNLHLDGGWDGKVDVSKNGGEWDHLFDIRNSKNLIIENNLLRNPFGDCIFIGGGLRPGSSRNMTISNNKCFNPWRAGIAFISADNVKVYRNLFSKLNGGPSANGAWYHFNIDFEPNVNVAPRESVWNVEVAFNKIDSQVPSSKYMYDVGIGVGLSYGSKENAGGNIMIHDNVGTSPGAFFRPDMQGNGSMQWINTKAYRNPDPTGCWDGIQTSSINCVSN